MIDVQVAVDKLGSMGTTEEIRSFLQAQGAKGTCSSEDFCVIAQWMRSVTCQTITVCLEQITLWEYGQMTQQYEPSDIVSAFIDNFDDGCYPELEE